jgi:uncharacterized metal-binding protein
MLTAGFIAGGFVFQDASIQYAIGSLIGVMVTPDCDVDAGTIHGKYLRQRIGRAAELFWDALWYFYRRSLKHGSELSHFPIISTLGCIVYLYFFLIALPILLVSLVIPLHVRSELAEASNWIYQHWRIVVGLMGADLIHWGLDILTTEHGTKRKTNTKLLGKGKHSRKRRVLGVVGRSLQRWVR